MYMAFSPKLHVDPKEKHYVGGQFWDGRATTLEEQAKGAGHGGMDFIEDLRLIDALRQGRPLDMDVYDAAAWSVVTELSERSVARGGAPQEFPDFTRGRWKKELPLAVYGA